MRKRVLFASCCILAIPLLFSPSQRVKLTSSIRSVGIGVAFAGHTTAGGWCDCGAPECICDPGEVPGGGGYANVSSENGGSSDQSLTPIAKGSHFDFGTGTLIFALALFLWARLRL
jgi:hypothetical protein